MVALACVVLVVAGLIWAVSNQSASARLLAMVPGLKLVEPSGTLWGDFQSRRLEWHGAGGRSVTLVDPRWRGLTLTRSSAFPWRLQWRVDALEARSLQVVWPPSLGPAGPLGAPVSLNMPFGLKVVRLSVDRVESNLLGAAALTDLQASVALQQSVNAGAEAEHRVRIDQLHWQGWQLTGEGKVATTGPMSLAAHLHAAAKQDQLDASADGPLASPQVQAHALLFPKGHEPAGASQSLTAEAKLLPFQAWPVLKAQVSARQFDLQRLVLAWPATALTGEVVVQPRQAAAGNADLWAHLDLANDKPGLWDGGRVPLQRLLADVTLPGQASMGRLGQVGQEGSVQAQLTLPAQPGSVATVALDGRWSLKQRASTHVTARLAGLDLRALHSLAPALRLKGQVEVQGQANQAWQISGTLNGDDGGAKTLTMPVQARWMAHWWPGSLKVDQWTLAAGAARAEGSASWDGLGVADAAPKVELKARLSAFDPAAWMPWPRPAGDALQRTRLDGDAVMSLSAPVRTGPWQGRGHGALAGSMLLGVPLDAQWQLDTQLAGRDAATVVGKVLMKAAGNQVQADVRWPLPVQAKQPGLPTSKATTSAKPGLVWPDGVQIDAKLDAPALARWQPWAQVLGMNGLAGQAQLEGQWASSGGGWHSQGRLNADGVGWQQASSQSRVALQGALVQWALSSDGGKWAAQPWAVSGDVARAQWGEWVLQQAHVSLDGPWRDQRLRIESRVDLPERKLPGGGAIKESVKAQLAAQGGWQAASGPGGATMAWQGQVQALKVQPLSVAPVQPWLEVQPFEVRWARDDNGMQWRASPTKASVFGASLAFNQWQWQSGPQGSGQFDLDVALEPLKLAEVLARWQPHVGWGGDLSITGQVKAIHRTGQGWAVDAHLGRQEGDLSLMETAIDGANVQRLGIRQIRVDLKAHDGVWTLSELLDGRVLGQVEGSQVVQVKDASALPGPQDLLSGHVSARVENLRPLAVWAPPGWRLSGLLQAKAGLSGTLGAPQYNGEVKGEKLGLGNALLGVQLSEGDLLLSLQGDQARLDHFTARGGGEPGGLLTLSGDAFLGAAPAANLKLTADHFGLLQRVDRRAMVSGDAQVSLGAESIKVDGRMRIDEGLLDLSHADAPTVGDDVVVTNRPDVDEEEQAAAAVSAGRKRKLAITLVVDLGQQLRLRGRGLDTRLGGALRLTTPAGRPQVQGAVSATGGTYAAYGQKLVIERGTLTFTGPLDNPRLDIQAMRSQSAMAASTDVKVGVLITGTAQDPRVRLYSEPPMSETEKLSWLVLGRGPAGLGGADIGLLQTAASALLAGEGGSTKDTVMSAIGLDELSVRQTDGAVRDTIVTVGKQISSRWYLGYERSLNATTGSWQAIYRLAQRFTLRAQTGDDNALDVIWSWRWD